MNTVAIVQARMTSTRLPGKVLADLLGAPMLERQITRLRRARSLDAIVVATTVNASDDPVAALADRLGIAVYRGSEHDVLERYLGAADLSKAEVVVRLTADCPLVDGAVVDEVVRGLFDEEADYASNVFPRTFPRGLDAEALTRRALERCAREARSNPAREHVTWYIHTEQPEAFRRASVISALSDASDLRWTVDTVEDLAAVTAIYRGLDLTRNDRPYAEILAWVRAHPEVTALNGAVEQKRA